MEILSAPDIQQLSNTTSPSGDIIYLINYLIYNESKIDRCNITANINVGNYENNLSNRIRIILHKNFATFHHDIFEYSKEKFNILCR